MGLVVLVRGGRGEGGVTKRLPRSKKGGIPETCVTRERTCEGRHGRADRFGKSRKVEEEFTVTGSPQQVVSKFFSVKLVLDTLLQFPDRRHDPPAEAPVSDNNSPRLLSRSICYSVIFISDFLTHLSSYLLSGCRDRGDGE